MCRMLWSYAHLSPCLKQPQQPQQPQPPQPPQPLQPSQPPQPPHRHLHSRVTEHSVACVLMSSCRSMEVDGAGTSAWRRRQRRLRSWIRHERQTVAMELAAALHHSRDVGPGTHAGLRAQKAASSGLVVSHKTHSALPGTEEAPPGVRPGSLVD